MKYIITSTMTLEKTTEVDATSRQVAIEEARDQCKRYGLVIGLDETVVEMGETSA